MKWRGKIAVARKAPGKEIDAASENNLAVRAAEPPAWSEMLTPAQARRLEKLKRIAPVIVEAAGHPLMEYVLRAYYAAAKPLRDEEAGGMTVLRWMLRKEGVLPQIWLAGVTFRELLAIEIVRRQMLRAEWIPIAISATFGSVLAFLLIASGSGARLSPAGAFALSGSIAMLCLAVLAASSSIEAVSAGAMRAMRSSFQHGGLRGALGGCGKALIQLFGVITGTGTILAIIGSATLSDLGIEAAVTLMLLGVVAALGWRQYLRRALARRFEKLAKEGQANFERLVRSESGDSLR